MSRLKKILWLLPIAFFILHLIPRNSFVHSAFDRIPGYNMFVIEIRDTKPYKALKNTISRIFEEIKNYEGERYDNLQAPLIVEIAKSYIGIKYQFGGTDRAGVDCSGLVYCVCRDLGVVFPRSVEAQSHEGRSIFSMRELLPGDLLFFDYSSNNKADHVGIYIGNNRMIYASSDYGRVMQVRIDTHHYRSKFLRGKRIVK